MKPDVPPTLKQKYDWLCSKLKVRDLDFAEHDGLIGLKEGEMFFCFSTEPTSVDEAIVYAMQSELEQP